MNDQTETVSSNKPITPAKTPWFKKWCGPGMWVATGMVVVGRLALEPLRAVPHYDEWSMESTAAVEKFRIRAELDKPMQIGMFGSSVAVWGVLSEVVADAMHVSPYKVHKLAAPNGTPFDFWTMVRRNPEQFSRLKVAMIEINPRMMLAELEIDERIRLSISQHATVHERMILKRYPERFKQMADLAVPLLSVRRSLRSVMMNILQPQPGADYFPKVDMRLYPLGDWHVTSEQQAREFYHQTAGTEYVARRLVGNWKEAKLQHQCLSHVIEWFQQRKIPVVLYQVPVHPNLVSEISSNQRCLSGLKRYNDYLESWVKKGCHRIAAYELAECGVEDFGMRDLTHLNEIGAKSYSRWLGGKMLGISEMPEILAAE